MKDPDNRRGEIARHNKLLAARRARLKKKLKNGVVVKVQYASGIGRAMVLGVAGNKVKVATSTGSTTQLDLEDVLELIPQKRAVPV